jgi:DNA-binding PadR family transcriptional regulator
MVAEQPRHGYELMRAIEERMGGSYCPSPGVIYPTLSWLEDMGYACVEAEGGRKSYAISEEGKAFLTANRAAIDEVQSRMDAGRSNGRHERVPGPVIRGMENLKLALRLRLRRGQVDEAAAKQIATALDAAAQSIERS